MMIMAIGPLKDGADLALKTYSSLQTRGQGSGEKIEQRTLGAGEGGAQGRREGGARPPPPTRFFVVLEGERIRVSGRFAADVVLTALCQMLF